MKFPFLGKKKELARLTALVHGRMTVSTNSNRGYFAVIAPGWIEGTRIGVPSGWPGQANAIFLNTYTGACLIAGTSIAIPPPNQWQSADLKPLGVPDNALAVHLSGFLVITSGTGSRVPDLAVSFRAPGAIPTSKPIDVYIAQDVCIGPLAGALGGDRTNFGVTVPLKNGIMEWGWLRGDSVNWSNPEWPDKPIGSYPENASYGLNISVQAYILP